MTLELNSEMLALEQLKQTEDEWEDLRLGALLIR